MFAMRYGVKIVFSFSMIGNILACEYIVENKEPVIYSRNRGNSRGDVIE